MNLPFRRHLLNMAAIARVSWHSVKFTPTIIGYPSKTVKRFEDIDAIEWMAAAKDEDYVIIHEDSGQLYGERKFLAKMESPIKYYFSAMSGGKKNTRQLAKIGAVKNSVSGPNGHEFSGGFFDQQSP